LEVEPLFYRTAVNEDADLIKRAEGSGQSWQGLVHLLHHICRQVSIEHYRYGKRKRVTGKKREPLIHPIFAHDEVFL
jgi:hypothetical protein